MADVSELVKAIFATFSQRDIDAFLALCDPRVRFWPQGTAEHVARSEPYVGHDGIRQYFADVARAWRTLELLPGELRVAGDGVVAFGRARGIRRDGEAVDAPVIWVFKARNGVVVDMRTAITAEQALRVASDPSPPTA